MATLKKVGKIGRETLWAVMVDGREVGTVSKAPDTRTTKCSYVGYAGIGETARHVLSDFDKAKVIAAVVAAAACKHPPIAGIPVTCNTCRPLVRR
jgi:hypothetical protein